VTGFHSIEITAGTYGPIRCVDAADFLGRRSSLNRDTASCVADWARIGAPGAPVEREKSRSPFFLCATQRANLRSYGV